MDGLRSMSEFGHNWACTNHYLKVRSRPLTLIKPFDFMYPLAVGLSKLPFKWQPIWLTLETLKSSPRNLEMQQQHRATELETEIENWNWDQLALILYHNFELKGEGKWKVSDARIQEWDLAYLGLDQPLLKD